MYRTAIPFPVLAGKTEADITRIARRLESDPVGYFESRQRAGVTLERAYLQHTPMGDFVVAYVESHRSAADVMGTFAEQTTEVDRFFAATIREVHGINIADLPDGPPPETVGEWVDSEVTGRRRGMAFCAPVIPEQKERAIAWAKGTFGEEGMTTSRRALQVNLEVATFSDTPQGPIVAVYLEGVDPYEANRRFTESADPFDARFRDELGKILPTFVDFSQPVPGVTEIFDSSTLPRPA